MTEELNKKLDEMDFSDYYVPYRWVYEHFIWNGDDSSCELEGFPYDYPLINRRDEEGETQTWADLHTIMLKEEAYLHGIKQENDNE